MKYLTAFVLILGALLAGCAEKSGTAIAPAETSSEAWLQVPNRLIALSVLHYHRDQSLWTLNGEPYSGFSVSYYHDSIPKEKTGILNGKKENQTLHWYPDGHLKRSENYHLGKLHGEKKVWSADSSHTLVSQLHYRSGKPHGEQLTWYPTGELHKRMNLNMGREEGMQEAFRKNGTPYAHYEAKEGRTFGLKKASLCYGLENETIHYED